MCFYVHYVYYVVKEKPFGYKKIQAYFCTPQKGTGLTHGVTVALQILVLSVKVRILMGQQKSLY